MLEVWQWISQAGTSEEKDALSQQPMWQEWQQHLAAQQHLQQQPLVSQQNPSPGIVEELLAQLEQGEDDDGGNGAAPKACRVIKQAANATVTRGG
jgi:hypothetical protein